MAPRVPRHISMDLIKFAKKVDVWAYPFSANHKSAYEFARQIGSPKLGSVNPNFAVSFEWLETPGPSRIFAEFANGSTWDINGEDKTCADLRYEFFEMAALAEEAAEEGEETAAAAKAPAGKKK